MTQAAKIIDVSRSFIPVDANTYMENLHGTSGEDAPELRVPVIPYKGWNFLPTSNGYKSFFGANSKINIGTLVPNKADAIFIFQSNTYENVLIALCDTGIWIKKATVIGSWIQLVTLTAPVDGIYYEWTYCVIKNKLYAFRNNGTAYYKIESDPAVVDNQGVICTTVSAVSFITLTSQLGMFRLGSRLGFWDANNAVSWSSPDDYTDFKPAVLTGANVTTFNIVKGRISAIRSHGPHAVVYASKSIVLLGIGASETFLVKAAPILDNGGCPYLRNSIESMPDHIHFAYTDIGIYRITDGRPEQIVPDVYDYFKSYNSNPVYLALMQGRFLVFEVMSLDILMGNAQFTKSIIGPTSLVFTAPISLDELNAQAPGLSNMCDMTGGVTEDFFTEQKAAANTAVPPNLRKKGTSASPVYTCHISNQNGVDPDFAWTDTPCGAAKYVGGNFQPAPNPNLGVLSRYTTDGSYKTTKTGAQVYGDGKWTMQRFVQFQTAIWKIQEGNIRAFMEKLTTYGDVSNRTTNNTNTCAVSTNTTFCTIGRYPTNFSSPQFGFNKCSFWLTRYALTAQDVINHVITSVACTNNLVTIQPAGYKAGTGAGGVFGSLYSSPQAAITAYNPALTWIPYSSGITSITGSGTNVGQAPVGGCDVGTIIAYAIWQAGASKVLTQIAQGSGPIPPVVGEAYPTGYWDQLETKLTGNGVEDVIISPTPDTGYCELTGYNYTNLAGNAAFMAVSACADTNDKYPGAINSATRAVPLHDPRPSLLNSDGSFCGLPFEVGSMDNGATQVVWTDESVNYPGSNFLLQLGSIAPRFPTKAGAFVYDLELKKWGKIKLDYKQLLDYSPINSTSKSPVSFDTFGILAGALLADGYVYLFDDKPATAEITWGKIGYYRLGMTDCEEIRIDFKSASYGTIRTEVSLDGRSLGTELTETFVFGGVQAVAHPSYDGRWFNITVTGKFDVNYMEFRGYHKGRR